MARKPTRAKSDRRPRRGGDKRIDAGGQRSRSPDVRAAGDFPTKEEVLTFIQEAEGKVGKREIARAFAIKSDDRKRLKVLLAEMAREGLLVGNRRELRRQGALPTVTVLEIVSRDDDGELIAEPIAWNPDEGPRPRAMIREGRSPATGTKALGIGDRVLCRIGPAPDDAEDDDPPYVAEPIKRLPRDQRRLLGIFHRQDRGATIRPIDRKALKEWPVRSGNEGDARNGDLVRFELLRKGRFANPEARIVETLGNPDDQRQISLIAIHSHAIPDDFPESVVTAADALEAFDPDKPANRTDLRHLPLLTIDPVDARDHDDAVHASPDTDPANEGGHVVTVAIADVAHYVHPGSVLDREAQLRGNSVYFPDRVVPMLPERISNDLCSLREGEDRPCLAIEMVFDKTGKKRRHKLMRAVMRSAAKLSYQEAQAAFDGTPGTKAAAFVETALAPLWTAYRVLAGARDRRGPLELDLPERRIVLDENGRVAAVHVPERLEAHRLIEEFMIQANVAAAELLEAKRLPVVYRVHERPSKEKLKALRDFLETLEISLPAGDMLRSAHFNSVLSASEDLPVRELVHEVILRSQSQAVYATENVGHFGLNLLRYAHFTSPIRRYADLLVHRCLISLAGLGEGGLRDDDIADLKAIAEQISTAERRAMAAERETIDRLIATHLADRIGAEFTGRIAGVARSGLFVRLTDSGADGYIPASTLADEYYAHDEQLHALVGERTGGTYRLGDRVSVRLLEVIPSAGAIRFEMLTPPGKAAPASRTRRSGRRKPAPRRGGRR
ncbi:MAG: hypothetical protein RLZ98_3569 [Pseudomonadota bacterium]|jgi:ribonuclease R